jgi:AcrR family transcriptional regulator
LNDRKKHVVEKAHRLFIEKGFTATSIQDILDYSGISKGTFYNYFSSKNELIMAIFRTTYRKMENERNALITGRDPSDPELFIKQIQLQMKMNRENNIIPLFEEVFFSNDNELKKFLEIGQLKNLRWTYERLTELVEEEKHPYLLDAAIMLKGVLQQNIRYFFHAYGRDEDALPAIRFSVNLILKMVDEAAKSGERLMPPEKLDEWLPPTANHDLELRSKVNSTINRLKKLNTEQNDYIDKLNFIQEELLKAKAPRKFLIDSVLLSLSQAGEKDLNDLRELVEERFSDI